MINFFLGFGVGSILSMFCLCLLQAASKLDEMAKMSSNIDFLAMMQDVEL